VERFKTRPADLSDEIRVLSDEERLRALHVQALRCESISAFREVLAEEIRQ
jgi:hypothetical protein